MTSLAYSRLPAAAYIVQHVKHSTPPVTITAPAPEQRCIPYDVVSESNRESYVAQSAATRGGRVAQFVRR